MNVRTQIGQFRQWQHKPHEVMAMAADEHDCPTCHTHYVGNYCPRCGQSAKIGRYSFKKAFLLFIDVWGLGNRGMFRTLRDLLLRPGYMIRDYLMGMQMAYFPPFKMLFLLTALSVLVAHGLNIEGKTYEEMRKENLTTVENMSADDEQRKEWGVKVFKWIDNVQQRFPNIITVMGIFLFTLLLYPAFRHSKNIPDLRLSEFLIAMVYSANMTTIYETALTFVGASNDLVSMASALIVIPLKQLSGFTWKRTILSIVGVFVLLMLIIIVLVAIVTIILASMGALPED